MEFTFLGTGAGMPAKERNVTSIALNLSAERGTTWLFDCGEGTQHQILKTPIRPRRIEKIFISHLHGDHIFGLPGLLGSRSFQDGNSLLTLYGPKGIREFIEIALFASKTHLKYELDIIEMNEDEEIIFEDDQFLIEAKKLEHGITSYGFRITECDQPGALQVDALRKAGIPPGPIYQKIKNGERVVMENGHVLDNVKYIGEVKKGRILAVLGDTRYTENAIVLSNQADVLIHEATFSKEEENLAFNYFHATTAQAATIANLAGVKNLILTHISSRYQSEEQELKLLREARAIFPETYIAKDLWTFPIQ
jgi:ribonuclease Z